MMGINPIQKSRRHAVDQNVVWYDALSMNDVDKVGGKNASLGEMVANLSNAGEKVPNGYATTAFALNQFLETNQLNDRIYQLLDELDVDDVNALKKAGTTIHQWVSWTPHSHQH